jgi:hypothetical protein
VSHDKLKKNIPLCLIILLNDKKRPLCLDYARGLNGMIFYMTNSNLLCIVSEKESDTS